VNATRVFFAAMVVTLLVHATVVNGEFLFYDDARFIVRNESIESLANTPSFFSDLSTTASADAPTEDIYRPLRTFSYAVLTSIAGKSPTAFHMTSLLFHALTAGLLSLVFLRTGLSYWPALAGALAWAVHPVMVESTAWICSLGDLMCGCFSLLSLLAYIDRRRMLALVLLTVALFAKEAAVVVPGIWLAWDYFFRRDETRAGALRGAVPGLAVVLCFLIVRGAILGARMNQVSEPLGGSHGNAILTMLSGFGFYISTILFPFGSTVDARVPIQTSLTGPVVLGLLALGVTIFGVFRGPARTRFGAAWFLMALVPASNVIVTLKIPTADRFLYLPLMGAMLFVGEACQRWPRPSLRVALAGLVLLSALTFQRIGDWNNDGQLLAAWRRVNPKSKELLWADASYNARRTLELLAKDRPTEAVAHFKRANELYALLLKNVRHVPIQVWMEAAELQLGWAKFTESIDRQEEYVRSYSAAFRFYRQAWQQQLAGQGRVIEEEVIRAATMVGEIATRLADMRNPEIDRTIQEGMRAFQFLRSQFGIDTDLQMARLVLAKAVRIRAEDPEKARAGFDQVLKALDHYEEQGVAGLSFLRAQCFHYRSLLRDRPFDRSQLQRAAQLYAQAAEEIPGFRYWGLFYAARAKCIEGRVFKDTETGRAGFKLLQQVEAEIKRKKVAIPGELKNLITSELAACGSRG